MKFIKSFAQLLIVLLTPALLRAQQNLPEPKLVDSVTVVENADLTKFVSTKYVLDKERTIDVRDTHGTFVVVALRNAEDKDAPILAFLEENNGVNAATLKTAAGVKMEKHPTDQKKVNVLFLDKEGKAFFKSTLSPFAGKSGKKK